MGPATAPHVAMSTSTARASFSVTSTRSEHKSKVEVPAHCSCCTAAAAAHGWRASAPRQETAWRRRHAAHLHPPPAFCACQPSALGVRDVRAGLLVEPVGRPLYERQDLLALRSEARSRCKRALGGGMPAKCKRLWFLRRSRCAPHVSCRSCRCTHCSLLHSTASRAGTLVQAGPELLAQQLCARASLGSGCQGELSSVERP